MFEVRNARVRIRRFSHLFALPLFCSLIIRFIIHGTIFMIIYKQKVCGIYLHRLNIFGGVWRVFEMTGRLGLCVKLTNTLDECSGLFVDSSTIFVGTQNCGEICLKSLSNPEQSLSLSVSRISE